MSRVRDFVRYMRALREQQENNIIDTTDVTSQTVTSNSVDTTAVTSTTVTSTDVTTETVTATAITASSIDLNGEVTEQVYILTGTDIDPANGTIQIITLTANTTLTSSLADGESITLMVDDGAGYAITWPTIKWAGGEVPVLATTGYSAMTLWQAEGVLYGASVGDLA